MRLSFQNVTTVIKGINGRTPIFSVDDNGVLKMKYDNQDNTMWTTLGKFCPMMRDDNTSCSCYSNDAGITESVPENWADCERGYGRPESFYSSGWKEGHGLPESFFPLNWGDEYGLPENFYSAGWGSEYGFPEDFFLSDWGNEHDHSEKFFPSDWGDEYGLPKSFYLSDWGM
jgi:hypothetical protein